jgi:acetyl esterase/lipase
MHRRLRQAKVKSDLFLFDGLWHAFVMDPTLPESREAYGIVWGFFDQHLGRSGR